MIRVKLLDIPGIKAALARAQREIMESLGGHASGGLVPPAPVLSKPAHERAVGYYANAEIERIRTGALGMKCPADGTSCFDLDCQRQGCQGGG